MATGPFDGRANAMLEHECGKTDIGALGNRYLALSTSKPANDGSGVTEPTIGTNGYTRVQCDGATWGTAASRSIANASAVSFPTSTGAWGSGALAYWVLYSASSGGTAHMWGTVANPPTISAAGATPSFAAGELTATFATTQ